MVISFWTGSLCQQRSVSLSFPHTHTPHADIASFCYHFLQFVDWHSVGKKLVQIPGEHGSLCHVCKRLLWIPFVYPLGVVETGLFVKMAYRAYFGQADGTVIVLQLAPDWESYISIRHGGDT